MWRNNCGTWVNIRETYSEGQGSNTHRSSAKDQPATTSANTSASVICCCTTEQTEGSQRIS